MCGIGGFADFTDRIPNDKKIIEKMSKTLSRRGPDQIGNYINNNIAFIHRRLSVIDLSHGLQPMLKEAFGNKFVITYNGELYNTSDLRSELSCLGYKFNENSDTEVLLTSYIEWGEDCVSHLNGIFAFAIYDEKRQKIFIARDRAGVKPFFYSLFNNTFVFGSEIKTILSYPHITPQINNESLAEVFLIGPGRTSGKTPFSNIFELRPGECGVFSGQGLKKRIYWSLKAHVHLDDFERTKRNLRELICDSISRQTVSDVPLCCFLSGGLDSSIITTITAKTVAPETLTTYSVDYADNDKYFTASVFQPNSDSDYISLVSENSKTDHNIVTVSNTELAEALSEATFARDLPCMADVDSSLLLFCRQVKKTHTVALSGECADEIFGGYPWFRNEKVLWKEDFPWSGNVPLKASFLKDGILDFSPTDYVYQKYSDTVNKADFLPSDSKIDKRIREITMLNINWFMQGLLDRKDRMSMYSGLEVRVPFCDHRILEYAYNIPWEMKNYENREKGLVREAFSDILPYEIVWRKKSPYPKTHNPIYFDAVKKLLKDIIDDKTAPIWQFADFEMVKKLYESEGNIFDVPWYGQLMTAPQIFAYFYSINLWLKTYKPIWLK
ncbi:MAG: asparagine synthase (glutamine-hydrolyzing) [Ruminococcaceae bacterium]|nr:asparagine synthase (glutamine-hydrolyzing) [Oscillospiraceae bacterium]